MVGSFDSGQDEDDLLEVDFLLYFLVLGYGVGLEGLDQVADGFRGEGGDDVPEDQEVVVEV